MLFKIYDCDFGMTIRGVNYNFTHVDNMTIDDPERTRLIRGANAGNKVGLTFTEGAKEAKTVTVNILDIPMDLHNLMKDVYAAKERVDCYCISRTDGSSKIAKNAVLSQEPKQLSVDESADSLAVALIFESFDVSEIRKS